MTSQKVKTYHVVGEPEVKKRLEASLAASGFAPAQAGDADVVFTYCVGMTALEDAYYDSKGLLQSTKKDVILIDLSPATVSFAQELCAMGSVSERHVLDAPLVVRNMVAPDAFAHVDNLGMVVGGAEEVFRRAEPMLRALARRVMWMGKAGSGQSAKIGVTLTTAASLIGLVESCASFAASEAEVDSEDYLDFALSMGVLTPAQEAFLQAMEEDNFENASFTVEYLMAELAAALTSVDDGDLILPHAEAAFRLMELLAMVGGVSFGPAALKLVFADEETGKKYHLDWAAAEGAYEHDCDCDHDDPDHECMCGHDHDDPEHECCGGHHHGHNHGQSGFIGFSSN